MKRATAQPQSGLILIELILVLVLTAIMAMAIGYCFVASLDIQRQHTRRQSEQDTVAAMERRITKLLQGAKLTDDASDATTYMVGSAYANGDTGTMGCDQLVFTTVAEAVPAAAIYSTNEFETQHKATGPVGGVAEIRLDTDPIGKAGDRSGLFIRVQRPSDSDTTQGGTERVLCADIQRMGFEFWDGLEWIDTWDTTTVSHRLPAAIRVNYTLKDSKDSDVHRFTVQIPSSDVDAGNAVSTGTSS